MTHSPSPQSAEVLLQRSPPVRRWVPRIAGFAGAATMVLVLAEQGFERFPASVGAVIVWGVVYGVLRLILGWSGPTVAADFARGVIRVGRREHPFGVVRPLRIEAGARAGTSRYAAATHVVATSPGHQVGIRVVGRRGDGMGQATLPAYERLLQSLTFGPQGPGDPWRRTRDPWKDEWLRAEMLRHVAALRQQRYDGGRLEPGWDAHAGPVEQFLSPAAQQALQGQSGPQHSDVPAQHAPGRHPSTQYAPGQHGQIPSQDPWRAIDEANLEVGFTAMGVRTIRRVLGLFGALAAAAAVVGFGGMLVTPAEGSTEPLFTLFAVLFIVVGPAAVLLLLLHGAAHDLHLRRCRAAARRLLAPGAPAGHAAAVLYTNWWQRAVAAPALQAPTIGGVPQEQDPYDPDQEPAALVLDSGALPERVEDAWRRNPRRLAKMTAATAGLAAVAMALVAVAGDASWLLAVSVVLGVGGVVLHCWARRYDLGRPRQDIVELARLLEQMRTDPAYGAHVNRPGR